MSDAPRTASSRRCDEHGVTDVDDSALARSLYASDASLYRIAPRVVVRPRHTDEIAATLAVARETGTPLTMRGAGTSIAGNAVGAGIVVDTSRHLNRVLDARPRGADGARRSPASCTPRCSSGGARTGCGSGRTRRRTPAARSAG